MSETTDSESNKSPTQATVTEPQPSVVQNPALIAKYLVIACSVGLCACFFLPWVNIMFINLSGYQLANQGTELLLFWLVPGLAAIALLLCVLEQPFEVPAILAALAPFVILAWGLNKYGTELLQGIQPGGWITLGLSVVLFIAGSHKK